MLPKTIKTKVIKGKGRGKTLGFPTINFQIIESTDIKHGIYAGIVQFGRNQYKAALHYGPKPVFQETDVTLEAYILSDIPSVSPAAEVTLLERVRDIKNFSSKDKLVKQIKEDVRKIEQILNSSS